MNDTKLNLMDALQEAYNLAQRGEHSDAERIYLRILEFDRDQHEARRHFAKMLAYVGRIEEAIEILEYTAAKEADDTSTLVLLANALNEAGRKVRAGHMYRRLTSLAPDCAWFQWCYAHWLLGEGRLAEGYQLFDWGYAGQLRRKRHLMPEWDGSPIPGKRLYIVGEMGMGDVVLYSRFVQAAKQRSQAQVVLEVHEPLVPLFTPGGASRIETGADEIVATDPNYSFRTPFDAWINTASLPRALGVKSWQDVRASASTHPALDRTPQSVRSDTEYCPISPMRPISPIGLTLHPPIRVGLAWKGNPKNPIDRSRSLHWDDFKNVLGVDGVHYVNLQYDEPSPEGVETVDISTSDRLAIEISQCNFVVSVDTFVANLACAIGVPTHVLVGLQSDYRWTHSGMSTPWYDAAIVHRQKRLLDWSEPIENVRGFLQCSAEWAAQGCGHGTGED